MMRQYWIALRGALVGWLLMCVLGTCSVGVYFFRQSVMRDQLTQLNVQLHSIQERLAQQTKYRKDISFYESHKSHWQQLGLIQPPSSEQWISSWYTLQQDFALTHMQYDIQPSVSCEGVACGQVWIGKVESGFSTTMTPIKLRWSVAHEGHILDWLQHLQHIYQGMLLVRGCKWEFVALADSIAAECELDWFNFPNLMPSSLARVI